MKDGCLVVQVADDGCGMTPEKLEEVQREVAGDLGQISEGGFGLPNIQKRIQLAYGADYGIHVSSRRGLRDSGHTADSDKIVKKLRSSRKKQKSGFPAGLFFCKIQIKTRWSASFQRWRRLVYYLTQGARPPIRKMKKARKD